MSLTQLIYASQPFGYDSAGLYNILSVSRSLNERDGLTGALMCRADVYLQLLEGPQDKIDATYAGFAKMIVTLTSRYCSPGRSKSGCFRFGRCTMILRIL